MLPPDETNILGCPNDHGNLIKKDNQYICLKCQRKFHVKNGSPLFVANHESFEQYEKEIKSPLNKFKSLIKKQPWLFQFLTYAVGSASYFGKPPQRAIRELLGDDIKNRIIINIGSGTRRINPHIINLDIFPFKNVDIVADARSLPFKDNTVDMIVTESTLEHIPNVFRSIAEITRVIKPGGFIYASIPFIMPFHASPNDYVRLTHVGLKTEFSGFETLEVKPRSGPVSGLITFLMYFLALPFSIFSETVYNFATYVFMVILSPLRIFDLLFDLFPRAVETSAVIYFIGKKK